MTADSDWTTLPQLAFDALFEGHPLPSWIYDLSTLRFLEVNRAATERYGYSREEFLAMTLSDIRPIEEIPALLENVSSQHEANQDSRTWRHKCKNNAILFVRIVSRNPIWRPSRAVRRRLRCPGAGPGRTGAHALQLFA
jgi:PAS domain S-box-containing protein